MKRYHLIAYLIASFAVGTTLGLFTQIIFRFSMLKVLEMSLLMDYLLLRSAM